MDIGFKSDVDQDKQSLMELIRTAKEFNKDLKEINNTKVIILIRDDIKKYWPDFLLMRAKYSAAMKSN